jgi:hypothetical protein
LYPLQLREGVGDGEGREKERGEEWEGKQLPTTAATVSTVINFSEASFTVYYNLLIAVSCSPWTGKLKTRFYKVIK